MQCKESGSLTPMHKEPQCSPELFISSYEHMSSVRRRNGRATYRSVISSSKQNLLSNTSVVLRTHDFSVTDSVSPCKSKNTAGRIVHMIVHK